MSHPDEIRDTILDAALKIAPFEGWTRLTLKRAVRDAGYPDGADELYFEGGIGELLNHWSDRLNANAEAEDWTRLERMKKPLGGPHPGLSCPTLPRRASSKFGKPQI